MASPEFTHRPIFLGKY